MSIYNNPICNLGGNGNINLMSNLMCFESQYHFSNDQRKRA